MIDRRVSDRRIAGRVHDDRVGLGEISPAGIIEEIDGGAMAVIGTTREDWVGKHIGEDLFLHGLTPALQGRTVLLIRRAPMPSLDTDEPQLWVIVYSPRYDMRGRITGAIVWWFIVDAKDWPHAVVE